MSSDNLENLNWSPRNPAERILMMLKMHGCLTSAKLGTMLGTSGEAARQQLVKLSEEGLVEASSERTGVGRPTQKWTLTEAAQGRFPDTHAALTVQLLDIIRTTLGENALDGIIAARENAARQSYEAAMRNSRNLRDRVETLSGMRSAEGYMADWEEAEDGSFLLMENHCPICAAATTCQNFCRAELQVFQTVLGPDTHVERTENIVNGGRRCTYVIRELNA